jgi:hypothetical protein
MRMDRYAYSIMRSLLPFAQKRQCMAVTTLDVSLLSNCVTVVNSTSFMQFNSHHILKKVLTDTLQWGTLILEIRALLRRTSQGLDFHLLQI